MVGRAPARGAVDARDQVLGGWRTSKDSRHCAEAKDLRRRHRAPELLPHQDRAARRSTQHPDLELQLVVAASALLERYGNAVQAIEHDGFAIAARVYMVLEGENLVTSAKSTGLGLLELATVFDNLKPDVVVTIADRYETLATAVAASYMNIPVAHVQGGEVTGSIDEKVRHAVTKLSNLHLVSTSAGRRARASGWARSPAAVVVTGCPSIDLAAEVAAQPALDFDPFEKYGGVGPTTDLSKGYLVVMQHPVTTEYDEARQQVDETLHAVQGLRPADAVVLAQRRRRLRRHVEGHPRVPREREARRTSTSSRTCSPRTSCGCCCSATAIVGNSSVGIRECSFLGVPVVNIGSRQQGRERGQNVIDVGSRSRGDRRRHRGAHRAAASRRRDHLYGDGTRRRRASPTAWRPSS